MIQRGLRFPAPLTEKPLTSLKFASRQRAIKAMKAEGRPFSPNELHFIGNAKRSELRVGRRVIAPNYHLPQNHSLHSQKPACQNKWYNQQLSVLELEKISKPAYKCGSAWDY
jgi:hypothetical protein